MLGRAGVRGGLPGERDEGCGHGRGPGDDPVCVQGPLAAAHDPFVETQRRLHSRKRETLHRSTNGTHREAARGLRTLLRELDVRPEHVPSILRRPEDPLILPAYLQPVRIAGALTLTVIAGRAHHGQMSLTDATKLLAATVPAQARRLAQTQLLGTHSLRRLAPYARLLHHDGLRDLAGARSELRHLTALPADAARQLPTGLVDRTLAAAWVWLDATHGRPAGGPHPNLAPTRFLAFAANLDPETRLHLRAWWQRRLAETQDLTQSATAPAAASHPAATGTGPFSQAGGHDAG